MELISGLVLTLMDVVVICDLNADHQLRPTSGPVPADHGVSQRAGPPRTRDALQEVEAQSSCL